MTTSLNVTCARKIRLQIRSQQAFCSLANPRWIMVMTKLIKCVYTQLPKTENGHTAIIVFVDRLSILTVLSPARTDMGAKEVAYIFMDKVCSRFGFPKSIVSDRDTRLRLLSSGRCAYTSALSRTCNTAFHPQTDGQTERMNRVLDEMLRVFGGKALKTWDLHLLECEFAINNIAFNASIRNTPFFLNYGRHPKSPSNIATKRQIKADKGTSNDGLWLNNCDLYLSWVRRQ